MGYPKNYASLVGTDAVRLLTDREWMHEQYVANSLSTREIAKIVGCGKKAVNTALRRLEIGVGPTGVNRNKKGALEINFKRQTPAAAHGKLNNELWLKNAYLTCNKSIAEIAEDLGVSFKTVKKWKDRFGLAKTETDQLRCSYRRYKQKNGFDVRSEEACKKRMRGRRGKRINTIKGGELWCHSSWEEEVARFLDRSDIVESFSKDSISIPYVFESKQRKYYPDFLINTRSNIIILEVKADKLQEEPRTRCKLAALRDFCSRMGYKYAVVGGTNRLRLGGIKL